MQSDLYTSSNQKYFVSILSETEKENYGVVNSDTYLTEYKCMTLPQAIGVCEQFDYMLSNSTWRDLLSNMFKSPFNMDFTEMEYRDN